MHYERARSLILGILNLEHEMQRLGVRGFPQKIAKIEVQVTMEKVKKNEEPLCIRFKNITNEDEIGCILDIVECPEGSKELDDEIWKLRRKFDTED